MATPRFFSESSLASCHAGELCLLSEVEARHAVAVLRLRDGERAELFDGEGIVIQGVLEECGKRRASLCVEAIQHHVRSAPFLTIAFAPPKGKRCLAAIETLTELGVDRLQPLRTVRGIAEGGDLDKWRARATEASKQCHRPWIPEVAPLRTISELPLKEGERLYTASLEPQALDPEGLRSHLTGITALTWVIGPEGGLTVEEEECLKVRGGSGVRLAPHILRIATAAELACGLTRFLLAETAGRD